MPFSLWAIITKHHHHTALLLPTLLKRPYCADLTLHHFKEGIHLKPYNELGGGVGGHSQLHKCVAIAEI